MTRKEVNRNVKYLKSFLLDDTSKVVKLVQSYLPEQVRKKLTKIISSHQMCINRISEFAFYSQEYGDRKAQQLQREKFKVQNLFHENVALKEKILEIETDIEQLSKSFLEKQRQLSQFQVMNGFQIPETVSLFEGDNSISQIDELSENNQSTVTDPSELESYRSGESDQDSAPVYEAKEFQIKSQAEQGRKIKFSLKVSKKSESTQKVI